MVSRIGKLKWCALNIMALYILIFHFPDSVNAQGTANGEIENRPAPVARRMCLAGTNAGDICNDDADCPGSTCRDRNIFNISVAVHYDAPAADLTAIQNMITAGSAVIFDVTDGQAEIGQATIHNNSTATDEPDVRVYTATCTGGTSIGAACNIHANCPSTPGTNDGRCGVWWGAETGSWKTRGSIHVSINYINAAATPGRTFAHEFVHLVFDSRDEYETRPGCGPNTNNANCPDAAAVAAGQTDCLMDDSSQTELCWGHGDPTNLTDMTGGNHDATDVTEQSECRSNRSCWDQIEWSWPNCFSKPAAAPDPAAGGAVVNATKFVSTDDTVRVVLVLDESGSMDKESPKRIERLKVAAKDFVALAENGSELGIVSYATDADVASGRTEVAIAALGANRNAWTTAIDGLSPDSRTNIGAGLDKARNMIMTAGGVTANTYIVLMTDGLNNEPRPQATADADLTAKLATLMGDGIPVYVTCTGSDMGLASQCSEIATGTGGHYVDSADSAQLAEAFADFHERINGHQAVFSIRGDLAKLQPGKNSSPVFIEEGSQSVSFVVQWHNASANAEMTAIDPDGNKYGSKGMPQGRFLRVANPKAGEWQMIIESHGAASPFVARAYVKNPVNFLAVGMRYASIVPNGEIYVYAYPKNLGLSITSDNPILADVVLPDGKRDVLKLHDLGRVTDGHGDDVPYDGVFTGVYSATSLKGPYQFLVKADVSDWRIAPDAHERQHEGPSTKFMREVRLSTAVHNPRDVETNPEDPKADAVDWCERYLCRILLALLIIGVLNLLLVLLCCCGRRFFVKG